MNWLERLPPDQRAELRDAGRIGNTRFHDERPYVFWAKEPDGYHVVDGGGYHYAGPYSSRQWAGHVAEVFNRTGIPGMMKR